MHKMDTLSLIEGFYLEKGEQQVSIVWSINIETNEMVYQYRHKRNGIISIYTKEMLSQYRHKRNSLSVSTQKTRKNWSINIDTKEIVYQYRHKRHQRNGLINIYTKERLNHYRHKRNGLSVSARKARKKYFINIDTKELVYQYPRIVATKNEKWSEKLLVYD